MITDNITINLHNDALARLYLRIEISQQQFHCNNNDENKPDDYAMNKSLTTAKDTRYDTGLFRFKFDLFVCSDITLCHFRC